MPLIEARGLTKKFRQAVKEPGLVGSLKHFFTRQYRDKMAVDHIDLSVEAGESVAYLGPNGAGKSTTIKMLTGILVPTSGSLIVDGLVPYERRQQNAPNIGVVFGQRTQLWWDIPVVESFNLARDRVIHFQLARPPESMALICAGLPACETTSDDLRLSVRFGRFEHAAGEIAAAVMPHVEVIDFHIDEPEVGGPDPAGLPGSAEPGCARVGRRPNRVGRPSRGLTCLTCGSTSRSPGPRSKSSSSTGPALP
jgi:ABC-2 type transport system ATP-binding protein